MKQLIWPLGPICTTLEKLENGVFILKIFLSTLRQRNMKVQQLPFTILGDYHEVIVFVIKALYSKRFPLVRVCKLWDKQLLMNIVRKSAPRFKKIPSLVLIRLVLTEIQRLENIKINKEMPSEHFSVQMATHFFVNFDIFKWLYLSQN